MVYKRLKEKWQKASWDKKIHYVIVTTVTLIFVILYLRAIYRYDYKFKREPARYTVGEIYRFRRGAKVPPWFEYKFYIKGKKYKGTYDIATKLAMESNDSLRKYIGKRYIVKFNVDDPSISVLIFDKEVLDGVKAPDDGWESIPTWIIKPKPEKKKKKYKLLIKRDGTKELIPLDE